MKLTEIWFENISEFVGLMFWRKIYEISRKNN